MTDFIKYFREVKHNNICLLVITHITSEVMDKRNQLCFTGSLLSESVLQGVEEIVVVSMGHDAAADYMLHYLTAYTCQADRAVVHRIITLSFILIDRGNKRVLPILRDNTFL